MREIVIARPFAGGYRSDVPDYALEANECAYSQDLIYPNGISQQRYGWSFDGSTATSAQNLSSVTRLRFPVTETTRTMAMDALGDLYIHNSGASGTLLYYGPTQTWLPRCMYNGEILFCAQSGETPLLRYAGSSLPWSASWFNNGLGTITVGAGKTEADLASATYPAEFDRGAFFTMPFPTSASALSEYPGISARILSRNSTTSLSLDSIRNATASSASYSGAQASVMAVGFAFPAVSVWETGTMTSHTGSSFSISGGDISSAVIRSGTYASSARDALMVVNTTAGSPHFSSDIASTNHALSPQIINTVSTPSATFTNTQYKILRRLPFKDVAVHNNSLWGAGVKQYPNRVYVAPPLWNIGLPPGAIDPFDPTVNGQFADVDEFLLTPVDVPSKEDSDPVVALLATPGPLLVLKGASIYGIFGTYPTYEQNLISSGSGCIDLRSAISVDGVAYWAGRDGIYVYSGGRVNNLARGRVQREWQALMRGYVDGTSYVSASVVSGHLVISAGGLNGAATAGAQVGPDSSAPTQRTFVYDLNTNLWTSRLSNADFRNMATIRVPGEVNSIFAVSDDRQGRVIDLTPSITGTKCTDRAAQTLTDADPNDAAGDGPRMQAWTGASLAAANGVDGEARFADLAVTTNLVDSAGSPTAAIDVSTSHGGGLDDQASTVVAQGTITGDSVDRVDRKKFRVNQTGRLHQVRIDMDVTPATTTKTQIPEITATFRDSRRMT
jgi:hypothetical protein